MLWVRGQTWGQALSSDTTQVKNSSLLRAGFRNPPPGQLKSSSLGCQLFAILRQDTFLPSVTKGWLVEHELVAESILKSSWAACLEGSLLLRGVRVILGSLTWQFVGTL